MGKDTKLLRYFAPILIILTIVSMRIINAENLLDNADYFYLYNRARQLLVCIQDGNPLDFYYQDINGLGYGSSFFYGSLTLLPFLPLLNIGSTAFLNAYILIAGILFVIGTLYLSSKFTTKYVSVTCLFILSTFVVQMFSTTGLIANYFALGLSFLFIGCCIDFFRDNGKFIFASLLFFLILNTHLITAVLSFIICVFIFIVYFDKKYISNYIAFAIVTTVFCLHYIVMFVTHIDKGMLLGQTTTVFTNKAELLYKFCGSKFVFSDVLTYTILRVSNVQGYSIFGFGVLLISLIVIACNFFSLSKKELFCIICFVLGVFCGIDTIWLHLMQQVSVFFQFPLRYMFYLLLGFYIIVVRRINKHLLILMFVFSVPNLLLFGGESDFKLNNIGDLYNYQFMNGEYLYDNFEFDLDKFESSRKVVIDENKDTYTYVKDKDILYIKYDTDETHTLSIPKLYYKGYVCKNIDNQVELPVLNGNMQFINITIPANSRGIYAIYYDASWMPILQWLNYWLIAIIVGLYVFSDFRFKNQLNI